MKTALINNLKEIWHYPVDGEDISKAIFGAINYSPLYDETQGEALTIIGYNKVGFVKGFSLHFADMSVADHMVIMHAFVTAIELAFPVRSAAMVKHLLDIYLKDTMGFYNVTERVGRLDYLREYSCVEAIDKMSECTVLYVNIQANENAMIDLSIEVFSTNSGFHTDKMQKAVNLLEKKRMDENHYLAVLP